MSDQVWGQIWMSFELIMRRWTRREPRETAWEPQTHALSNWYLELQNRAEHFYFWPLSQFVIWSGVRLPSITYVTVHVESWKSHGCSADASTGRASKKFSTGVESMSSIWAGLEPTTTWTTNQCEVVLLIDSCVRGTCTGTWAFEFWVLTSVSQTGTTRQELVNFATARFSHW